MTELLEGESINLDLASLSSLGFPMVLPYIVGLILIAFYSYRVFKVELAALGAIIFGNLGFTTLAPMLLRSVPTPEGVNLYAVIGVICAIVGAALMSSLHKLAIFVSGGAVGFLLGQTVYGLILEKAPGLSEGFLGTEIGMYVVIGSTALIAAILMSLLFKPIFILTSSLGGMYLATALVANLVYPGICALGDIGEIAVLVIGALFGIIAASKQFKAAKGHRI